MNSGRDTLERWQCDALRGIAIVAIFLHNYCHWLPQAHKENEYGFALEKSRPMWDYWTGGGIDAFAPIQFFAFFGHYGVPLFLFLSGYGLVMKYERAGAAALSPLRFMRYQWLKLFRLMFLGFVVTVAVYLYCGFQWQGIPNYLAQLAMVMNLYAGPAITPGPYWYFGLMLQVYLIYCLLLLPARFRDNSLWRWLMPVVLIAAAWLMQAFLEDRMHIVVGFRYNTPVAMLPFAMGVLAARYGLPRLPGWGYTLVALAGIPLLALMNMNYQAWLWGPVAVIAGAVSFIKLIENAPRWVAKPMVWTGGLSAGIFVVHSIVRLPMFKFHWWRQHELTPDAYLWLAAYIALTLLLAWLYRLLLGRLPKPKL